MARVDIVVPRSKATAAIRAIHRSGLVHLAPVERPPGVGPAAFTTGTGGPTGRSRYESALGQVAELAGLLASASPGEELVRELWELDDARLAARVAALAPVTTEATRLAEERLQLVTEVARLDSFRRVVEGLAGVVGRLPRLRGYASTGIVVGARYRAIVPVVRDELETLTDGNCEVIGADLGPDRVAAILLYPVRHAAAVATMLGGRDLEEVLLPPQLTGISLDDLGPRLVEEQRRARDRLSELDGARGRLAATHGPRVEALRLVLRDRIAEATVAGEASASDHLMMLSGWLPARRVGELRATLERELSGDTLVVERPSPDAAAEDVPVALENGPLVRAFEPLASFVAVPRYGTLDPTPLLAVTLPAFIGLMVGDAGYGLLALMLLALARLHWSDRPAMRAAWPIGLVAAASTIAFGLLFGEFFGETGGRLFGLRPILFDRSENVIPLLVLALSIGLAQVGLGLVLGMVNAALLRHRRELASRAALLTTLVAVVALLAVAARRLPADVAFVAGGALVLAAVLLVLTVGIAGPIEALGVLGNVLSYARLMAIGLASVMLAVVADRLSGIVPNVLAGALVAGVLHALNLSLGFFDASIQGLRLHYVEFFTKFVEPGGTTYAPFVSVLDGDGLAGAVRARINGGS